MQRYKGETEIMGWPWISVSPKRLGGAHSVVIITPSGYIVQTPRGGAAAYIALKTSSFLAKRVLLRKSSCFLSAAASRARTTFALQRCGFRRGRGRVRLSPPLGRGGRRRPGDVTWVPKMISRLRESLMRPGRSPTPYIKRGGGRSGRYNNSAVKRGRIGSGVLFPPVPLQQQQEKKGSENTAMMYERKLFPLPLFLQRSRWGGYKSLHSLFHPTLPVFSPFPPPPPPYPWWSGEGGDLTDDLHSTAEFSPYPAFNLPHLISPLKRRRSEREERGGSQPRSAITQTFRKRRGGRFGLT